MNLLSKRDLKRFPKSEILGFTGSVFNDFSLKTSRQAPAATAWEKKTKVNNIKNNTKVKKNQIKKKEMNKSKTKTILKYKR